jgi:hypothetical protein
MSIANTVVVPFQDVLGLDARHRMNTPGHGHRLLGVALSNGDQVNHEPAARLAAMTRRSVVGHGRFGSSPLSCAASLLRRSRFHGRLDHFTSQETDHGQTFSPQ